MFPKTRVRIIHHRSTVVDMKLRKGTEMKEELFKNRGVISKMSRFDVLHLSRVTIDIFYILERSGE
jgi:hypothetical protein